MRRCGRRSGCKHAPSHLSWGHADWWSQNLRWKNHQLHMVFDWDSVTTQPEAIMAGGGVPVGGHTIRNRRQRSGSNCRGELALSVCVCDCAWQRLDWRRCATGRAAPTSVLTAQGLTVYLLLEWHAREILDASDGGRLLPRWHATDHHQTSARPGAN